MCPVFDGTVISNHLKSIAVRIYKAYIEINWRCECKRARPVQSTGQIRQRNLPLWWFILAKLYSNKVVVFEKKVKDILIQKGFGEKKDGSLVLDLKEAIYLLEKKKLSILDKDEKDVSFKDLMSFAEKKEKNFYNKFIVYSDIREKGYVIKTGFKFGFDFRVYPRGKKPGEDHSKWVIHVATQDEKISIPNYSRMVRLSGNLKTELLISIVDSEDDVNYYSTKRITP